MKFSSVAAVSILVAAVAMPVASSATGGARLSPVASIQQLAPRSLLRGSQCLDPTFARGWVRLDDRHILVDAGRKLYRIELTAHCPEVQWTPFIGFRGEPISGRVCGGAFDYVVTRSYPCPIQGMEMITREEYKAINLQQARERAERRAARRRLRS